MSYLEETEPNGRVRFVKIKPSDMTSQGHWIFDKVEYVSQEQIQQELCLTAQECHTRIFKTAHECRYIIRVKFLFDENYCLPFNVYAREDILDILFNLENIRRISNLIRSQLVKSR